MRDALARKHHRQQALLGGEQAGTVFEAAA